MKLKLNRPLVFFDLETTGTDILNDRIVEMSFVKLSPDGQREIKTRRINPTIPISKGAMAVHGISDEDVKDCPTFGQVAKSLYEWLKGSDFAGFNSSRFDVPMLVEELFRAGVDVDIDEFKLVDVQTIYHKNEPRTLGAAYKFYCGKEIENAHSAQADIEATVEILLAQVEKYSDIGNDVKTLAEYSKQNNFIDLAGRFAEDSEGNVVFNFGKYKGQKVIDVFDKVPTYYNWIMNGEFSQNTKQVCTRLRLEKYKK